MIAGFENITADLSEKKTMNAKLQATIVRRAIRAAYPYEEIKVNVEFESIVIRWSLGPSEQDIKNALPKIILPVEIKREKAFFIRK